MPNPSAKRARNTIMIPDSVNIIIQTCNAICAGRPKKNTAANANSAQDCVTPLEQRPVLRPRATATIPTKNIATTFARGAPDIDKQSAIAKHLFDHPECALVYRDSDFSVLSYARSKRLLSILEAIFIQSLCPDLCVQKNSVVSLKLLSSRQLRNLHCVDQ